MGITIHYRVRLADKEKQRQLRGELVDICQSMSWDYVLIEPDSSDDVEHPPVWGLLFSPDKKCDPVTIIFDANGYLRNVSALSMYDHDGDYQKYVFTKTQFSTVDVHIVIVNLLRYIKDRFIPDLEVNDEGEYWETSDRAHLKEKMKFLGDLIEQFGEKLKDLDVDLTQAKLAGNFAEKLEEKIREMLGKGVDVQRIENKTGKDTNDSNVSLN